MYFIMAQLLKKQQQQKTKETTHYGLSKEWLQLSPYYLIFIIMTVYVPFLIHLHKQECSKENICHLVKLMRQKV